MTVGPGQTLSHYSLIEKIGEGAMGVVWKARDEVLGRTVAIKVLPADVAGDEHRRTMFLDEARLASSVSDAHIVQVYELGREGALDFIVMEYVEGKALNRILHGRPLPPEKVAQLGHQVAQALARAHRKGLLHRDLKPSNILVTPDGEAKVLDFGLATLFERRDMTLASMATTETATDDAGQKPAGLVGTPPYMSPEQARAETLDARSDIFSLGVVLYEMTTGQRPFWGSTIVEVLKEIVRARPKPPHELSPKMPLDLDRIIQKALAPAKAERYQTMDDLAVDLKRLGRDLESGSSPSFDEMKDALRPGRPSWVWGLSGALGLALVVGGVWGWLATRGRPSDPRTILVVPLEVSGQASEGEFVGRAFAETIAVNLAQSKGVSVLPVPQDVSVTAQDRDSLMRSAKSAGAGRLLTGTLTRDGSSVHTTLSLIDTDRNRLVWGSQVDLDDGSLGPLAVSLSREILGQMGASPPHVYDVVLYMAPSQELASSTDYADTLAAFRGEGGVALVDATQRLVTAFPEDVLAHAWHLVALSNQAWDHTPSTPGRQAVERAASTLQRLDPRAPHPDWSRGLFERQDGHLRTSIATYVRLLSRDDLSPAMRSVFLVYRAQSLSALGEQDAAVADIQAAMALDPLNPEVYAFSAEVLGRAHRYDEALALIQRANTLAFGRGYGQFNWGLGYFLYRLGRFKESVEPLRRACSFSYYGPPSSRSCALLAMGLHRDGQSQEASVVAQRAAAMPITRPGLLNLAAYKMLTHERTEALSFLRRALDLEASMSPADITELASGEDFQDLRGDPEFMELLTELRSRLPKD